MARFTITTALLFFLALSMMVHGQDTSLSKKEQRKYEKEQKKKTKAAQDAAELDNLKQMLANKFFVFQGTRLFGQRGDSWSLSPNLNFLGIIDTSGIIQFGFDGLTGWNGVGGVTVETKEISYAFDEGGKTKAMTVVSRSIERFGRQRFYFVLTVRDNGSADLDLTIPGGTIRMSGQVVKPSEAGVFVGQFH